METLQLASMKKELIKRELETTPWEGLCELAKKQMIKNFESLEIGEVEAKCLEELGYYCGEYVKSVDMLATHCLVSATTTDILAGALVALEAEYNLLEDRDVESLYKIFVVPNVDIIFEEEVEITGQFVILDKAS
ncbi:MAG: hypothetical protein COW01_09945 [Bdellovibrionales bacterium CG12_big_fil_rev_8_21_14_0_65_38_15]|nr:MAG: hypothetical protein COW79_06790 [Bdellovibrionales bacterium CG22_combo_CG10-13_8_21_14_all_38_13]PIQ54458.1 MAG: hypothetical protein COW01_09945 [Bdellovibrionales bacterium CG12_big_fil_rev_8_21_14_0_65_38_15]PIR29839.1 MAG: hypothetical protein COV38_07790 [Bdellovibrionales bacterium CG11_big_fil_rev_8_21_14_0_20_38_13]